VHTNLGKGGWLWLFGRLVRGPRSQRGNLRELLQAI